MSRIANRYSKAIFELAVEQDIVDQVKSDLDQVSRQLEDNVQLQAMILNPLIQAGKKAQVLKSIFGENLEKITVNFLVMVCLKKRANFLAEIIRRFNDYVLDHQGILPGKIISAVDLEEAQIAAIGNHMAELTGKQVRLETETDADMLGGFVVTVKDMVIDLSVTGQLEKLREKLVFG